MGLLANYRFLFISIFLMLWFPQAVYGEVASTPITSSEAQPNKFIVILCTIAVILLFSLFKWWKDKKAA
ncbi:hypothetical protein B4U37_02630 [Sutcliffiella horikoshii]|uniref:Uncharacterized protein n=1 Tax=Sutcliffiella horikoshii TaxID=79883 RepID=A0ABM6KF66_9BACI|nr:hypothetical protein B4U37_02630 [Sutcliffiella horikoshii]